jgi:hypothetical protein
MRDVTVSGRKIYFFGALEIESDSQGSAGRTGRFEREPSQTNTPTAS